MLNLVFKLFPDLAKKREAILEEARQKAKELILQGKEEALSLKERAETELRDLSRQVSNLEQKIAREEERLEKERSLLEGEKQKIIKEKSALEEKRQELVKKFERLAGLSSEEARAQVLFFWEQKLEKDIAKKIKEAEERVKQESEERAREILLDAMRYGVTDYVVEYTLSTVSLPSEDFKGRIIGKEGRNIRAFELVTGVEVDLDEEGVVKLSSFDPVKREVARVSLERLIKDGRIQPSRIEDVVAKTKSEIEKIIYKEGESLCHALGVYNLPRELVELLGRFKYRFSYGQNMIQHTLEETRIGVALAHELGADVNVVRLACLLHDIGKVITDKEGSHIQLGVELLKKHRFPNKIIEAVETHHEDKPFTSVEGIIVYLADAISGGRPGARHEDVENYIKRMQAMEDFIKEKKGVENVSVLQAGREIRVIVDSKKLSDEETVILCSKLEEELEKHFSTIPGQIKITAIREFRTTAITRS